MKLTVDPTIADARYVYYFFRLPATVQKVINHASLPQRLLFLLQMFSETFTNLSSH